MLHIPAMPLWLKAFALSTVALLAPVKPLLVAGIVLVIIDTLTGIMAAMKRKQKITSAGLRRSVGKSLVYTLAILGSFVAETWLIGGLVPVTKLVAGALGVVELKSILENLDVVSGGSLFKSIISKLGSKNDKSADEPAPPESK